MKTKYHAIPILLMTLSISACLKTRAQLKDDSSDDASKGVAAQPVQDVHPQGQYVIDEVKEELTRIEGRIEDLEKAQKDGAKDHGASSDDLKKLSDRVTELEKQNTDLTEKVTKLLETPPAPADPNETFNAGKAAFDAKNYDKALESFAAYLKSPKNTKHVEEATFLKGESYYKLKQYKKSIVEFSKFPEKYTHSTHLPEALYRIGLCFDALGMKDDAKGFYQELVDKYPKSPEAKKAKKKVK